MRQCWARPPRTATQANRKRTGNRGRLTRPTDGKAAAEDLRVLAYAQGRRGVPGRAQLPVHRPQAGPEPAGRAPPTVRGQPLAPSPSQPLKATREEQHLMVKVFMYKSDLRRFGLLNCDDEAISYLNQVDLDGTPIGGDWRPFRVWWDPGSSLSRQGPGRLPGVSRARGVRPHGGRPRGCPAASWGTARAVV